MNCPYCGNEMISGILYGDRYANVWKPKNKEDSPKSLKLKRASLFKIIQNDAFVCMKCSKLIIDLETELDPRYTIYDY